MIQKGVRTNGEHQFGYGEVSYGFERPHTQDINTSTVFQNLLRMAWLMLLYRRSAIGRGFTHRV